MHKVQSKVKAASYGAGGVDYRKLFLKYDKDGSGTLDKKELKAALSKIAKLTPKEFEQVAPAAPTAQRIPACRRSLPYRPPASARPSRATRWCRL